MKRFNPWFLLPLLAFAGLVAFMAAGLNRDPHLVPSPLINHPAPNFQLPCSTAAILGLRGWEPGSPRCSGDLREKPGLRISSRLA
jgi:hypothetical protein